MSSRFSHLTSALGSSSRAAGVLKFDRVAAIYCLVEMTIVVSVAFLTAAIYWKAYNWSPQIYDTLVPSALIALFIEAITLTGGRLRLALLCGPAFLWSAVRTAIKAFGILIAVFFILKISDTYSRGVLLSQLASTIIAILALRAAFQSFVRTNLAAGRLETGRMIVLGSIAADRAFVGRLTDAGVRIVSASALDEHDVAFADPAAFARKLLETCRVHPVDQVVIAPSKQNSDLASLIVDALAEAPVTVHIVPPFAEAPAFRRPADGIGGLPTVIVSNRPLSVFDLAIKRSFDIAVSVTALIILAPLLLLVAVAIRVDSKGPVFFRQNRHGYGNGAIRVFKFRSMSVMEDGKAFRQATRNDPRITRVGSIIRRTNLDELPQLFNVLFGEMSIVGPRPHPIALNDSYADRIKWFHRRHNIRPGITGWAQINGYRGETETIEKMTGRVVHDLWYLDNWSIILDLKIVILTVFSPVAYRDAR